MFLSYIEKQGTTDKFQLRAAEHIDILTYNRIVDFEKLTPFQQQTISRVHSRLADFERENDDILSSNLSGYSLNGVAMQFGNGQNIKYISGIAMPSDLLSMLRSTGLCYPAI